VRSCNHCCSWKAIRVIHSECVFVALGIKRDAHEPYCLMLGVRLCNIFPHYLMKGTIFEKKVIEHKMCVLIFSTTFVWNISYSKNNGARYDQNCVLVFHVKYPLFLSDFNESWIFRADFLKNIQISNFVKILPVGADLFHSDGRTYRHDEADSWFSQFCESV
jgi:hypothetical protein